MLPYFLQLNHQPSLQLLRSNLDIILFYGNILQMVHYHGFYSNVSPGVRQKENQEALIPGVLDLDENKILYWNWARLIQEIAACPGHDPDPLTCSKDQGLMRIISIIEDQEVIKII